MIACSYPIESEIWQWKLGQKGKESSDFDSLTKLYITCPKRPLQNFIKSVYNCSNMWKKNKDRQTDWQTDIASFFLFEVL